MTTALNDLDRGPVLVLGRAGMDIYADPPGERVETSDHFFACLGGSAGNIAAGLARLGHASELVSSVSDDAVGQFVRHQLDRYGVGASHVALAGGEARTSLAVTETRTEATQVVIYRNGAADLQITQAQVDAIDLAAHGGLVVTGTALATEPSRSATLSLMNRARGARCVVILDVDYRPYSWTSPEEVSRVYRSAADACDMVVGNDEEFDVMAGGANGRELASALADEGRIAVYKRGPDGSETFAPEGRTLTGIFRVEALKPMGAGDAFMAGLVAGLAEKRPLAEALLRGSAAAAIVVSGIGCAPASPTPESLAAFMRDHASPEES